MGGTPFLYQSQVANTWDRMSPNTMSDKLVLRKKLNRANREDILPRAWHAHELQDLKNDKKMRDKIFVVKHPRKELGSGVQILTGAQ